MPSIRRRLALGLLGGSGVLLVAGLLVLWLQISRRVVADFDAGLLAEGRALTSLVAVNGGDIRIDFADEAMPQFSSSVDPAYFEVRRKDGTLIQRSASLRELTLGPDLMPRAPESIDGVILANGVRTRRVTLLTSPLQRESDESKEEPEEEAIHPAAATVYVAVAHGTARLDSFLDRLRWGILGLGGSMLLGTWIVILSALRWGLSPLDRLSREVERLDAESLGSEIDSTAMPAELQPIARQINDLLRRLELAFRRERDFSANVAHELRTPLAELRSLCDVALAYPGDGKALQGFFTDGRAVGLHMERVVESLLALAHAESRQSSATPQAVPLRAAIARAWEPFVGGARQRNLDWRLRVDETATAFTDRRCLDLILSNLLSNAASHAPRGTWIEVAAKAEESPPGWRLTISNPSPDLVAADLPRLFDRFWRKSAAREATGHFGLGLPLAAALASNLGSALGASLGDDHSLVLELHLPPSGNQA